MCLELRLGTKLELRRHNIILCSRLHSINQHYTFLLSNVCFLSDQKIECLFVFDYRESLIFEVCYQFKLMLSKGLVCVTNINSWLQLTAGALQTWSEKQISGLEYPNHTQKNKSRSSSNFRPRREKRPWISGILWLNIAVCQR